MLSATLAKHIQYINSHKDEKKLHVLTVWAIVDLESPKGREIGKSMFQFKFSSLDGNGQKVHFHLRLSYPKKQIIKKAMKRVRFKRKSF